MWCCFGFRKQEKVKLDIRSKYYSQITTKIKLCELEILQMMFNDLAERHIDYRIDQDNFMGFFHLNGMWGQMLFHSFDLDHTELLTFEEFVHGVANYIKVNEEQKIQLLFKFFERENFGGITYNQFLKMLYNYPKKDLKQMLNDKQFFNNQILQNAVKVQQPIESKRNQSLPIQSSMVKLEYDSPVDMDINKKVSCFEQNFKNLINYEDPGTSLEFNIDNKKFEVKSANINTLVKRFAANIYHHYKVDLEKGMLDYNSFKDWISHHPTLYNSYYKSFHNYIWQAPNGKPNYITTPTELESDATMLKIEKYKNVYLLLINTTIVICTDRSKEIALKTICLQGLKVNAVQNELGYGIQISHRDGLYKTRKFIFANQELQLKWLESLKLFKGHNIHEKYSFYEKIGTGKFSIVYRGVQNTTKQEVAIKVIETYMLSVDERNYISHESAIMSILNNPNVIRLNQSVQTKTHLYIVTEIAKGIDLFDYIAQVNGAREYDAALIIGQLIEGVRYLHSMGLVHRDIKPENIMVILKNNRIDEIERVKIIDFGFSDYEKIILEEKQPVIVGTTNYMAPQMLTRGEMSYQTDIFAVGVVMYYVLRNRLPFDSEFVADIRQNTIKCEYDLDDYVWHTISPQAKDLIRKFLQKQPEYRISLEEALNHPWFSIAQQHKNKKKVNDPFKF